MLNIHVCKDFPEGCLTVIDDYFKRRKKKEWFNRQDVKDIILGIDRTVAVKDEYLESPVFGEWHRKGYRLAAKPPYF